MLSARKAAPPKRAATKRPVPAKKAAPAKKARSVKRPLVRDEHVPGFLTGTSGLLLPTTIAREAVVPPNKLREGLEAAQGQIRKTLQGFASVFTQDFEVAEISLTLSFNAEGKFLGFGGGGEMSVSIKIVPTQSEA